MRSTQNIRISSSSSQTQEPHDWHVVENSSALSQTACASRTSVTPSLAKPGKPAVGSSKDQDEKEGSQPVVLLKDVLARMGSGSKRGIHYSTKLFAGGALSNKGSAGAYQLLFNGSAPWNVSNVTSTQEWSSINAIFDEFFVHKVHVHYIPVNRFSAQSSAAASASGSPGFVNTLGCSITGLQHGNPAYSEGNTSWLNALASQQSKFVDLGAPFTFTWTNVENPNFSWSGPADNTSGTQMWMNVTSSNPYGGLIQAFTPEATGASAGIATLTENGIYGHVAIEYEVSFRVRS